MSSASETAEAPRREIRTTAFAGFAMALVIGSYAINAMDRTLFPLILPEVAREYRFALPSAGLMSTVFTIGMAAAGMPTGILMSRFSRKTVAQFGLLIFSAATLLTIAAAGFGDMLLYRGLTGIGEAMQLTALLAIVAGFFTRHRGSGIGALNCSFGIGAVLGPMLGASILSSYASWRAPMIVFGLLGFATVALVAIFAPSSVTEISATPDVQSNRVGGAVTLRNRNTLLLVLLSIIAGLAIFGFLGMYPTYLRQQLHYTAGDAGKVMSIYGLGVLASVGGGAIGDRFPLRPVLGVTFLVAAVVGWLLFNGPADFVLQAILAFAFGVVFSGAIYVNLAAGHVKAVRTTLSARASGLFVTAFYAAASVAGYEIGWLASRFGWGFAGDVQLCAGCLVAALVTLALRPEQMVSTQ